MLTKVRNEGLRQKRAATTMVRTAHRALGNSLKPGTGARTPSNFDSAFRCFYARSGPSTETTTPTNKEPPCNGVSALAHVR